MEKIFEGRPERDRGRLSDIIDENLQPVPPYFLPRQYFGAISSKDGRLQSILARTIRRAKNFLAEERSKYLLNTRIGRIALETTRDLERALLALDRISIEALYKAGKQDRLFKEEVRSQFVSGGIKNFPALLIMDPTLEIENTRNISGELNFNISSVMNALNSMRYAELGYPNEYILNHILETGVSGAALLFYLTKPQIILTRSPKMTPICVPQNHITVLAGGDRSTAGLFCTNSNGDYGVTACFHGTGKTGTKVNLNSQMLSVADYHMTQDIVFIPIDIKQNLQPIVGCAGVVCNEEPSRGSEVRFNGSTNQNKSTRIMSSDLGLLRPRASLQLKVQTDPDTDRGDSGCALIDSKDRVLAFAFERTVYGDYPQFTDWIWAANALRSLRLEAI